MHGVYNNIVSRCPAQPIWTACSSSELFICVWLVTETIFLVYHTELPTLNCALNSTTHSHTKHHHQHQSRTDNKIRKKAVAAVAPKTIDHPFQIEMAQLCHRSFFLLHPRSIPVWQCPTTNRANELVAENEMAKKWTGNESHSIAPFMTGPCTKWTGKWQCFIQCPGAMPITWPHGTGKWTPELHSISWQENIAV